MEDINLSRGQVYASILQDLEDIVFCFSPQGVITYANGQGLKLLDLDSSAVPGKNLAYILNHTFRQLLDGVGRKITTVQPVHTFESPYMQYSDSAPWYHWQMRGIFDTAGQLKETCLIGRDISYQKKCEKTLRESEAKFSALVETARAVFILQDHKFRFINHRLENVLGYSNEEFSGLTISDIVHPDHREMICDNAARRQEGHDVPKSYQFKAVTKSSDTVWLDISADLIQYEGKPAVIAIANDITKTQRLRRDLEETESKFRQLTDTVPACIYIIQNRKYQYVNQFFIDTMGIDFKVLREMDSLELIDPEFHEQVRRGMIQLQRGEALIFRQDIRISAKYGSPQWMDISASIYQWEGKPAVLGVAYDITRRKQLQTALAQSENNFRQLSENSPNLIFVIEESKLVYFNRVFTEKTGYSPEECSSMGLWEFFHPQHWDMIKKMTADRLKGALPSGTFQTRMLPKDGREAWSDFTLSNIVFNGKPATLGVAIDISEQKIAQRQIEYLSYFDKLTGLYNRGFMEAKTRELDNEQNLPLSIIIGDLNGLKMVNDAFGHSTGDFTLQKVAHIISLNCRETDYAARWGGDEFVIMLPDCGEDTARRICARIYEECGQLIELPVKMSIALGTATKTTPAQDLEEVFRKAEDLMYRNKMLESRSTRSTFVKSLERTMWVRSHETQEHTERLREIVLELGMKLGLAPDEINCLTLLAALHDIGKIAIPNSILDKPGRLTLEEWDLMKKHSEIGYRIALSNPDLAQIADAILNHHERWDGTGYPLGVKGKEIPLISRILALADAYDVMTSGRPYQKGITPAEALEEIARCAGTQFDPNLACVFIDLMRSKVNKEALQ